MFIYVVKCLGSWMSHNLKHPVELHISWFTYSIPVSEIQILSFRDKQPYIRFIIHPLPKSICWFEYIVTKLIQTSLKCTRDQNKGLGLRVYLWFSIHLTTLVNWKPRRRFAEEPMEEIAWWICAYVDPEMDAVGSGWSFQPLPNTGVSGDQLWYF